MTGYEQYIYDVENNNIVTCDYVKLAVKRFISFMNRDDIYFDAEKVKEVIDFISCLKHSSEESSGKAFILENWQCFLVASTFGFKWVKNDKRVVKNLLLSVARKNGKSALIIAILIYLMIFEQDGTQIIECANSKEQANKVLLEGTKNFIDSIDPSHKYLKTQRNKINNLLNKSEIKIVSADSSKLDGLNLSAFVYDEMAESKGDKLYGVLKSSMGNRTQPLSIVCSTVTWNQTSLFYDMYHVGIEILRGIKTDDSFLPIIYTLDEEDDYLDDRVWGKANPNLDITIYKSYLEDEIILAKNNPSYTNTVITKDFNVWCSSNESWISNDMIIKNTRKLNIEDFKGCTCFCGVDLAAVNDLTAVSYLFVKEDKYYFFIDYYLPQSALTEHPQKEFYKSMHYQKQIKITAGNSTDYNYITADILRINTNSPIVLIYYDNYNATSWAQNATNLSLNLCPYSQSVSNFNRPTKEFLRLILSDKIILDENSLTRFCFNSVSIFTDHNENEKPKKTNSKSKIDGVIAALQALAGYLDTQHYDDDIYDF